jgi:hypothetical protein
MERRGALIIGWAADGASAHFKLMRQLRQIIPGSPFIEIPGVPTLLSNGASIRLPARETSFKGQRVLLPLTPIIDPVHLIALYRNAALRANAALTVGNCGISLKRVRERLVEKLGAFGMEAQLGVRFSDFDVVDRMNFASTQRLFSTKLLMYLEKHCTDAAYKGTSALIYFLFISFSTTFLTPLSHDAGDVFYFRLGNRLLRSYLDTTQATCSIFGSATACCAPTSTLTSSRCSASSLRSTPCLSWRRGTRT